MAARTHSALVRSRSTAYPKPKAAAPNACAAVTATFWPKSDVREVRRAEHDGGEGCAPGRGRAGARAQHDAAEPQLLVDAGGGVPDGECEQRRGVRRPAPGQRYQRQEQAVRRASRPAARWSGSRRRRPPSRSVVRRRGSSRAGRAPPGRRRSSWSDCGATSSTRREPTAVTPRLRPTRARTVADRSGRRGHEVVGGRGVRRGCGSWCSPTGRAAAGSGGRRRESGLVRRVRTASATVRASTMPSAITTNAAVQASAPVMAWSRENIPTVRAPGTGGPLGEGDAPADHDEPERGEGGAGGRDEAAVAVVQPGDGGWPRGRRGRR